MAEVIHEEWMEWSKAVSAEVEESRRARWQAHWVPYALLPEDAKEKDRAWARRMIAALTEKLVNGL